jgi:hypothetical protein
MNDKNINTLVKDIYSLFTDKEKVVDITDAALKELAADVVHSVVTSINEVRVKPDKKENLRLSMIGQPLRKIWYANQQLDGEEEELSGSDHIKFLYGNILEALLIFLTKVAKHNITDIQKEVKLNGVTGHQDANIDGNIVDFKSASPFSFKKFKEGNIFTDDPFGYTYQISAYCEANDIYSGGFLVIDKVSGELLYCPVPDMEFKNASKRISTIRNTLKADEPPDRCYDPVPDGKSGNMRLDTGCIYCPYKKQCWADANNGKGLRKFEYSFGPKYLVKINSTPNVPEDFTF